ncbi:MAG: FHA domain-containing protein [Elusimicrobiota bacterium]|nr:FHA domain-containing protein [Elusimicrobiota bacterium]
MLKLVLKKKAEVILEYYLGRKKLVTVGSGKHNDIVIDDKNISDVHCKIAKENGKYIIKDNNTLFGTKLNNIPVTVDELKIDDEITIGKYNICVRETVNKKPKQKKIGADNIKAEKTVIISDATVSEKLTATRHFLLGIYGKFEGKKYELKLGETFVGREELNPEGRPNNVILSDDMTVSKGHAKFTYAGKYYVLADIGSTGGIAVNGKKIGQFNEVVLSLKDEISIGRNIFRFVEAGNDDYSPPKKQGIFLLTIKTPLVKILIITLLLISFYLICQGVYGIYIINSRPQKINAIQMNYTPEGNTALQVIPEYDISPSPAVADINSDGTNDIVFLNSTDTQGRIAKLYCWDGITGKLLWNPVAAGANLRSSPVVADVNNDSILDIAITTDNSMLIVIDGKTGKFIFRDKLSGISSLSPAVADLNFDNKPDIVLCTEEGILHIIYSVGFPTAERFSLHLESPINSSPVVAKSEKLPPTVVVCSNDSKIFLINGKTREKKVIDLIEKTGKTHLVSANPAVGDFDNDGFAEIVIHSNLPEYVSVIDISELKVNWSYFVEPVAPAGIKHNSPPVIVDIDNDGFKDVVILSANGIVYGLKGKPAVPSGEVLWKTTIGGRIISSAAIVDFDKDNKLDIAFGTEDGRICILKNTGEIIFSQKVTDFPITNSLSVADLDGDGNLNVVYADISNSVGVIKTNIKVFKNRVFWPIPYGRQYIENIRPYTMTGSGVGLFILISTTVLIVRKKKLSKRPKIIK